MKKTRKYSTFLLCGLLAIFSVERTQAQKLFAITGTAGGFNNVVIDKDDNIFFDDANNRIKKKNAITGAITTIAGNGISGHTGDGGAATSARIDGQMHIAVAPNGDVYIAEYFYNYLRKIDHTTGFITTVAGTGFNLDGGDGSSATFADIGAPTAIDIDKNGNIYIGNLDCIRKINATTNVITTVFGTHYTAGYTGSLMNNCGGIKVDAIGNIYFSDASNFVVRKINTSGAISTIGGNGGVGFTGDGGAATAAQMTNTWGIALDARGSLYVATNLRVRKINTGGIISTVAGTGSGFSNGLCSAPLSTNIAPTALAIDSHGDLYIGDYANNRILKSSWGLEITDVDLNTLCAPGSSTPAVTPAFTVKVNGGVAPYTYAWVAAGGNTATLSSTSSSNPTVTAVSGLASFNLTVSDNSLCLPVATRPVQATFNTNPTFDLAMRDSYYDMFDEPNSQAVVDPTKWDIWSSQDVWNRLASDGLLSHQDPCYGSPCTNYMYTNIRNVGCKPFDPTINPATVDFYWTIGGFPETWPANWNGGPFPPIPTLPIGNNIATVALGSVINPGGRTQLNTAWTPPNPQTYYGVGTKEMEVCFLARIKDGHNSLDPEGMTTTEGPGISANVRNNNNIVTRNTRVVYVSYYAPQVSWLVVGNSDHHPRNFNLEFLNVRGQASTLNQYMSVTVSLGPIFPKWIQAGGFGTYANIDYQNQTVTFDGTNTMELFDVPFAADEQDFVMVTFSMKPNSNGWEMNDETLKFRQTYVDQQQNLQVYGNYTFDVTYSGEGDADNNNGQGNTAGKHNTSINSSVFDKHGIKVFPNPAYTTVYFEFPTAQTGTIVLTDLAGRTLAVKELHEQKTTYFDVQQYAAGTYLYELTNSKTSEKGKIIISK